VSGLVPVIASYALLTSAVLLMPAASDAASWSGRPVERLAALGSLSLLLGVALGYLFNTPERVAACERRAGLAAPPTASAAPRTPPEEARVARARRSLWAAMAPTLAYLAVLLLSGELASRLIGAEVRMFGAALATAFVLDAAREIRARRAHPDLVPVWPEHRPYALSVIQDALSRRSIPWHARSFAQCALLRFTGPYVPVEVLVPAKDAARARSALQQALTGDAVANVFGDLDPANEPPPDDKAPPRGGSSGRRRTAALAAMAAALLVGFVAATTDFGTAKPLTAEEREARRALLQIVAVDDEDDPLEEAARASAEEDLPVGLSFALEDAPVGPGRTQVVHVARMIARQGEPLDAAAARIEHWLGSIRVPEGTRFALADLVEHDDDADAWTAVGLRTYLLRADLSITGADVVDAIAMPPRDPDGVAYVSVELTAEGAERFRRFTARNVKRRVAIVVKGRVASAPVITSEIAGGHLQITMGAGRPNQQLADAKLLAQALGGR
jgi:hypothetical protein